MPIKSFARPSTAKGAPPKKKASIWDGLQGEESRTPMPAEGAYRLRFISGEAKPENPKTGHATSNFTFEIFDLDEVAAKSHKAGDQVCVFFITNGKSRAVGMNRVFSLMTAAAGFSDVEEYRAFDPDGECYFAAMGESNEYSADGRVIQGRLVDCVVTRGKDDGAGGYYRNYEWYPVPDGEQTPAE